MLRPDLRALRSRLPTNPLTRFAPSPTGYLHLGHVVNAIYVWGLARALGGGVLLRIEDHDRLRSRPAFEAALLEDLDWLGFIADRGPVRQSDEPHAYASALETLARTHHVYACDCSRKDIAVATTELFYPGRCRTRGLDWGPGRGLRVVMAPGGERFDDGLMGRQEQDPSMQCGDLLLRDRDGHWTYQFAVVVDDQRQHIDLVIRGVDLLSSTGRQIRLARMLGGLGRRSAQREGGEAPPFFAHHPILVNPSGEKLSKSSGDTGVRELRAAGIGAREVIGRAAAAADLIDAPRPVNAAEVSLLFEG